MQQALQFKKVDPLSLVQVLHQACEETPEYQGKTSIQSCTEKLPDFDCYSIELGNMLIGGLIFKGNVGHIAVLNQYRRKWASREFYRFIQQQVKDRGIIHVKAGTENAIKFIKMLENRGLVCLDIN